MTIAGRIKYIEDVLLKGTNGEKSVKDRVSRIELILYGALFLLIGNGGLLYYTLSLTKKILLKGD